MNLGDRFSVVSGFEPKLVIKIRKLGSFSPDFVNRSTLGECCVTLYGCHGFVVHVLDVNVRIVWRKPSLYHLMSVLLNLLCFLVYLFQGYNCKYIYVVIMVMIVLFN